MLNSLKIFAIFAVASIGPVSTANDDLFSDVRPKSVFENTAGHRGGDNPANLLPKRVTSSEELSELLKSAGVEAKTSGSRTVIAKKKLDPWEFPVLAVISEDEEHIVMTLGLQTVEKPSDLKASTLLAMMDASQKSGPYVFGYSRLRERTEVSCFVRNNGVTGRMLRDEINRLAVVAKRNAAVWEQESADAETPAAATEPSGVSATTLVGNWSAARSATEAFAIEFTAKGSFNLVFVNNGKQAKSSGTFSIAAGILTMSGSDGLKLSGAIRMTSATTFTFTPENSKALAFTKA